MMTQQMTLAAALIAGVFSSVHCVGMCGGIAAAFGSRTPAIRRSPVRGLAHQLLFNGGRIGSYAIGGAIAGGAGLWLGSLLNVPMWAGILRIATGLLMVAIGLQLAINWRGLRHIEGVGSRLWRHIAPLVGKLMPAGNASSALAIGMLWGWLPCGLVYTMLLTAAMSGSAANGSALMVAFGLGTLPSMLAIGVSATGLTGVLGHTAFRRGAGALLLGFGVWTMAFPIVSHLSGSAGHGGHQSTPAAHQQHG